MQFVYMYMSFVEKIPKGTLILYSPNVIVRKQYQTFLVQIKCFAVTRIQWYILTWFQKEELNK